MIEKMHVASQNYYGSVALPMALYHRAYTMEKLQCIYGPSMPELFGGSHAKEDVERIEAMGEERDDG